jgi:Sigma-70, region 4
MADRPDKALPMVDEILPTEDTGLESGVTSKGRRRSKTMSRREMLREQRRMMTRGEVLEVVDYQRPSHRSQCQHGPRPCLFVSCKHNLFLDVNVETGSIKFNFPDKEIWELKETCALDVAERGGITLEEVGDILNLTRERVRQLEMSALEKIRLAGEDAGLGSFEGWDPDRSDPGE